MVWQSHEIEQRGETLAAEHVDITNHIVSILWYDEVLTMSARLCAATGDFAYEQRYNEFDPLLVSHIGALRAFIPSAEIASLVATTDAANDRLVAIEREAFALTHQGRGPEALASLHGAEYLRLKDLYTVGMKGTTVAANKVMAAEYSQLVLQWKSFSIASVIGIAALIIAWIAAVRSAHAWAGLRSRNESERYRQLEATAREKDEFLATISHSLKTPLNGLALSLRSSGNSSKISTRQGVANSL